MLSVRRTVWLFSLITFGVFAWLWPWHTPASPTPSSSPTVIANSSIRAQSPRDSGEHESGRELQSGAAAIPTLTGRLLQAGMPLTGVTVIACIGRKNKAQELERAVTDAQGAFELTRIEQRFWLTVQGDAVPHGWKTGWRATGQPLGEVAIAKPASIEGIVRNRQGVPIANAKITWMRGWRESLKFVDQELDEITSQTNLQGRFVLARLPAGKHRLYCSSPDYTSSPDNAVVVVAGEVATAKIVMNEGRTLRGVVMDHRGQPLAGADVWRLHGDSSKSDEHGRFVLEHHASQNIVFSAPGHIKKEVHRRGAGDHLLVRLERAVTLRATVLGANNLHGSVYLTPTRSERADASTASVRGKLFEWLDIVRDGKFELGGLPMSAFDIKVRVPGVGAVGPLFVEMHGDREITLALEPQRQVAVVARDELGGKVEGVTLVQDEGVLRYPNTYRKPAKELIRKIRGSRKKLSPVDMPGGELQLGVPKGEAIAFVVDAPWHLSVAKAVMPDEIPERIDITLVRCGRLEGVVRGGLRGAYSTSAAVFAADATIGEGSPEQRPFANARVGDDGRFVLEKLLPGSYRVVLTRYGTANIQAESMGTPLLDSSHVIESEVPALIRAGEVTNVVLVEPKLGRLVGRVLVRGVPQPDAVIVASRPVVTGQEPHSQVEATNIWPSDRSRHKDWDDELELEWTAGQHTSTNGAFTILYKDAGPVEIRVRHAKGHATSHAIRIELPAPGKDVVRDVEIPVGQIRGRFPIERLEAKLRDRFDVTLFPANKVHHDPFFSGPNISAVSMSCVTIRKPKDGAFAFRFLRSGTWLVRVHRSSWSTEVYWQQAVTVHNDVVDIGDVSLAPRVAITLPWKWRGKPAGKVRGVWLRSVQSDGSPSIWVATYRVSGDALAREVQPGIYEVVPFGVPGSFGRVRSRDLPAGPSIGGDAFAEPVRIVVGVDGSVEPSEVVFVALDIKKKD